MARGGGLHGAGHRSQRSALTPAQRASNKATPINGGTELPSLHGNGHRSTKHAARRKR